MPRFHFHIHDHRDLPDPDGSELPDAAAARIEAIRLAGEVLREDAERVVRGAGWSMDVTDAEGRAVYRVVLSTAEQGAGVVGVTR